jgi:beta-carotene hydroxylase
MQRSTVKPPTLGQLGHDLLRLSTSRRAFSLGVPFLWLGAYFPLAWIGWWPAAVFSLMGFSFVTYGSVSHDLVHGNLGLPRRINAVFLTLIELLALRSGHAYRAAHLNHHARYPHEDDVEGAAARMSLGRTLLEGVMFQPKIGLWALKHVKKERRLIAAEIVAVMFLIALAVALAPATKIPLIYVVLMIAGSWTIPLVTSYIPHDASGSNELTQTRLFRGRMASLVALEHLYHLEHHLYPAVPHHHWPELARRLDPFFARVGVSPAPFCLWRNGKRRSFALNHDAE